MERCRIGPINLDGDYGMKGTRVILSKFSYYTQLGGREPRRKSLGNLKQRQTLRQVTSFIQLYGLVIMNRSQIRS